MLPSPGISVAKTVSVSVHAPPRGGRGEGLRVLGQASLPSVTLTQSPTHTSYSGSSRPGSPQPGSPGASILTPAAWATHRSMGTSLGKERPPSAGVVGHRTPARVCKAAERLPQCREHASPLVPLLRPSFARRLPEEAGEEGLRVLHLALRLSQQRHCLSLLPGVVHDATKLLGSGPTQPGDYLQAPDTAHSEELRPLR